MKFIVLFLLLVAPAGAWTFLGDNILGRPFDYVTLRTPNDNDTIKYQSSTGKWIASAGGGGGMSSLGLQTGGVAQGTATTLNFTNGLLASGGASTTGNVSPTYGTAANTFTQGNDARLPVTPAAGNRGNLAVVNAGGTAYTVVDEGSATDQALMSLGVDTPGAFRALIATDIDELLSISDLTDVGAITEARGGLFVVNSSNQWSQLAIGAAGTVLHGSATDPAYSKVVAADAAVTGTGDTFVMSASPTLTGTLTAPTITGGSLLKLLETGGVEIADDAETASNISTLTPSANALTLAIAGTGTFAIDVTDLMSVVKITSPSGALNLCESSGVVIAVDNGTVGSTFLAAANTLTVGVDGAPGSFVIASGDRLKTDTLMSTGGTTVTIAESGGVEFTTDTFTGSTKLVPSIGVSSRPSLSFGAGAVSEFVIETDDFLRVTSVVGNTTALNMLGNPFGIFDINGANGSTFLSTANTLTMDVNGAAGALVFAAGDRLKLTGQAGAPTTFDAGSESYDTTAGNFIQAHTTGNVTPSGCTATMNTTNIVTGQTSFTDIGAQQTTAANGLKFATTFLHRSDGIYSTNSTDTYTWQLLYNATVVATFAAFNPAANAGARGCELEARVQVRSTGASGTVSVTSKITYQDQVTATTVTQYNGTAQTVVIDTTAAGTWKWQVKHSSSNAANTISLQTSYWQKVN